MAKAMRPLFAGVSENSCQQCGKTLNPRYKEEICPECKEINLFREVKEYIRANEVNEADVAERFGIPNTKVRRWIREGRIQYKNSDSKSISSVYCQICGKPLEFGNLCADCRHLQGLEVMAKAYEQQKGKMRFAGQSEEE